MIFFSNSCQLQTQFNGMSFLLLFIRIWTLYYIVCTSYKTHSKIIFLCSYILLFDFCNQIFNYITQLAKIREKNVIQCPPSRLKTNNFFLEQSCSKGACGAKKKFKKTSVLAFEVIVQPFVDSIIYCISFPFLVLSV